MNFNTTILFVLLIFSPICSSQEIGKEFINALLVQNDYDKSYGYFDQVLKDNIAKEDLANVVTQIKGQLGEFKNILEVNNQENIYFYYCEFKNAKIDIQISQTADNKINGFFFKPHQNFNLEDALGEQLNIKSNTIDLKGTLLLPKDNNKKKLVVFLHGSGPSDRDETVNENKPFKDIAEGLYKSGIGSYRFDKRTFSHPETFSDKSTIDDEYTYDAIAVINHLKKAYPDYDVIILGHSLGGYILPKIANQAKNISKIIIMAANSRPLDELIAEQLAYLQSVNPSEELAAEIEAVKEQRKYLKSKEFTMSSPKEKLLLNLPAAYWKSLLDYNLKKEAAKIKIPVFVLQGERDYQVTMKDFSQWKSILSNKNATFKSYPDLNHLFIAGKGVPTPEEYYIKGSVSTEVITDMESFILNGK